MSEFRSKKMYTHSVWAKMVKELTLPNVRLIDSTEVDRETWHTVQLSYPVAEWVKTQNKDYWIEAVDEQNWKRNYFDVHESLYTMIMLKWN